MSSFPHEMPAVCGAGLSSVPDLGLLRSFIPFADLCPLLSSGGVRTKVISVTVISCPLTELCEAGISAGLSVSRSQTVITGDLVLSMPRHDRLMGEGTRVVAVVTLSACPRPGTMPLRQRVGRGGEGQAT